MTTSPALIALDLGTSVARAALFRDGRLLALARRELELHFPAPGRAEQDPRLLLAACADVIAEAGSHLATGEPVVMGIAHQRSTVVLWDRETGQPFGPALSWRDARASEQAQRLAKRVPDLQQRTGLPASPHYGAPKIAWALRNWPEARKAADAGRLCAATLGTFIAWKLSRGECFATDPTNAQRMLLMDLRSLDWDPDLLDAAGIPANALPQVRPTDGMFGDARVGALRLPIRAMLGDQQAALVGAGDLAPGQALVQLGTGGFVLLPAASEPTFAPGLLAGLARADANKPRSYFIEGTVNSAGSALDRLRDLGVLRDDDDLDALIASATRPAIVVPAWAGLGAPWWESSARAAVMGWDESTTRADMVAGAVRGVAFLVADILDFMSAAGLQVRELALSGSLSLLPCVSQAIADATGRPAIVRGNPEATTEGIATVLATAMGAPAPTLSLQAPRRFEPAADLSEHRSAFGAARLAAIRLARRDDSGGAS